MRVLLFAVMITMAASGASAVEIRIGAQFPIYKRSLDGTVAADGGGRRRRAAFLMAVKHINNKTDTYYDDILPDHTLKIEVYDSKRDEGSAVVNAFKMWDDGSESGIKALVGPASSGPSMAVQGVYRLPIVNLAQVGYSATSPDLSESEVYTTFSRLPPSDAFQAKVIKGVMCHFKWNHVCTLSGSDSYSAAGIKKFLDEADPDEAPADDECPALNVVSTLSFVAGTPSVAGEVATLKDKGCKVVVLFAQEEDMKTVFREAERQRFTGRDAGVLWFASELLSGSYDGVCDPNDEEPIDCGRVLEGALMVVPNNGPGSSTADEPTGYNALADEWHKQPTKLGVDCDDAVDDSNREQQSLSLGPAFLWQAQMRLNPRHNGACFPPPGPDGAYDEVPEEDKTTCTCVAVNFTDYNREQAEAHVAETEGDGRVSVYVPYAYDSVIALAHGLHALGDRVNPGVNPEGFTGEELHEKIIGASFIGFSGRVEFNGHGDRSCKGLEYFLRNHRGKGGAFDRVGTFRLQGGNCAESSSGTLDQDGMPAIHWPLGGGVPDVRPTCTDADFVETVTDGSDGGGPNGGGTFPSGAVRCSNEGALTYTRAFAPACVAGPAHSAARPCCRPAPGSEPASADLDCGYVPWGGGFARAVVAICGAGALTNVAGLAWLVARRGTRAVKAGQYEFLLMYVVGCLALSLSPLAWLGDPTSGACVARTVALNGAAALVWAALAVKVWRVWRIFDNASSLKKKAYTTRQMIVMAARLLGLEAALLAAWVAVPAFRPGVATVDVHVKEARSAAFAYPSDVCTSGSSLPALLQGVVHGLALLTVAYMSFRARHAPTAFQESRWLSLVLMEVVTVGGIVFVVYYALSDSLAPSRLLLVQAMGTNINTVLACLLMLVPKARDRHDYVTDAAKEKKRNINARRGRKGGGGPATSKRGASAAERYSSRSGRSKRDGGDASLGRKKSRIKIAGLEIPTPPEDKGGAAVVTRDASEVSLPVVYSEENDANMAAMEEGKQQEVSEQ